MTQCVEKTYYLCKGIEKRYSITQDAYHCMCATTMQMLCDYACENIFVEGLESTAVKTTEHPKLPCKASVFRFVLTLQNPFC